MEDIIIQLFGLKKNTFKIIESNESTGFVFLEEKTEHEHESKDGTVRRDYYYNLRLVNIKSKSKVTLLTKHFTWSNDWSGFTVRNYQVNVFSIDGRTLRYYIFGSIILSFFDNHFVTYADVKGLTKDVIGTLRLNNSITISTLIHKISNWSYVRFNEDFEIQEQKGELIFLDLLKEYSDPVNLSFLPTIQTLENNMSATDIKMHTGNKKF